MLLGLMSLQYKVGANACACGNGHIRLVTLLSTEKYLSNIFSFAGARSDLMSDHLYLFIFSLLNRVLGEINKR